MPIHAMAEQAYRNYEQAEAERAAMKSMLRVVGKADPKEFYYGQSIWIIEKDKASGEDIITELSVYAYSADTVRVCRLNGVRTSVSRKEAIWMSYEAALDTLHRKKSHKRRKGTNEKARVF